MTSTNNALSEQPNHSVCDFPSVILRSSRRLFALEIMLYSAFFLCASVALFPFFGDAFYWLLLWIIFSLWLLLILRARFRDFQKPPVQLRVQNKQWFYKEGESECAVSLSGKILLWPWIIILPFRDNRNGKAQFLTLLADSLPPEDWRRLRVWLRTCL